LKGGFFSGVFRHSNCVGGESCILTHSLRKTDGLRILPQSP